LRGIVFEQRITTEKIVGLSVYVCKKKKRKGEKRGEEKWWVITTTGCGEVGKWTSG
jgi:hypothetical protein